ELIFLPSGSSVISCVAVSPVSVKIGDVLSKLPHVVAVAPVVMQFSSAGAVEIIYGIDLKSFERLGGPFRYVAGGPFRGPNDVLFVYFNDNSQHIKVDENIEVIN